MDKLEWGLVVVGSVLALIFFFLRLSAGWEIKRQGRQKVEFYVCDIRDGQRIGDYLTQGSLLDVLGGCKKYVTDVMNAQRYCMRDGDPQMARLTYEAEILCSLADWLKERCLWEIPMRLGLLLRVVKDEDGDEDAQEYVLLIFVRQVQRRKIWMFPALTVVLVPRELCRQLYRKEIQIPQEKQGSLSTEVFTWAQLHDITRERAYSCVNLLLPDAHKTRELFEKLEQMQQEDFASL